MNLGLPLMAMLVAPCGLSAQGGAPAATVSRPGAVAVVIAAVRGRGLIIDSTSLITVGGFNRVTIDSLMEMIPPGAMLGSTDHAQCQGSRERYCMLFTLRGLALGTDTAYVRANWGPVDPKTCMGLSAVFRVVMANDFPVLVSKEDEVVETCDGKQRPLPKRP